VVDVSNIESIGDSILVKDLPVPDGITILDDPETMVVVATAPTVEEVEEPEEELELEEGAEPEVIGEEEVEE
jgi:large subunit ribosomal protein L25